MTVDYTYYTDSYFGSLIPELEFAKYQKRAFEQVEYITLGNVNGAKGLKHIDRVKDTVCEVAELYYAHDQLALKHDDKVGVSSESVKSHSVTYDSKVVETQLQSLDKKLNKVIARKLFITGLLFGGL